MEHPKVCCRSPIRQNNKNHIAIRFRFFDRSRKLFFFRWNISVTCHMVVLKLAVTVLSSPNFRTLWPNLLDFCGHLKRNSVYDRKKLARKCIYLEVGEYFFLISSLSPTLKWWTFIGTHRITEVKQYSNGSLQFRIFVSPTLLRRPFWTSCSLMSRCWRVAAYPCTSSQFAAVFFQPLLYRDLL